MSLDPLKATDAVIGKYLDYLETTFALSDRTLHEQFIRELRQSGKFTKGPILEATPPFQAGTSLEELIEEGVLSSEFRNLRVPDLPVERNLYLHQEQAVRKLVSGMRNIIVSTGTGSGKTETFLLPILNHLFREKEQCMLRPGVRALLLYPMNALANDQLKRLRKLLKNYPEITFGSYTGETEREEKKAIARYRIMNEGDPLENELLSREQMKASPPHILLTNYAMLEYLLLRPDDNVFFDGEHAQDWRFIVIDEAHTYSGAKGIEMAMLLRRLKDRVVKSEPGALQCIGTSATLGGSEKDFGKVVGFGSGLFGDPFEWIDGEPSRQDVVTGTRKRLTVSKVSWGEPDSGLYSHWSNAIDKDNVSIETLIDIGIKYGIPNNVLSGSHGKDWAQLLYVALSGDGRLVRLQNSLEEGPCFIDAVAQDLFPNDPNGEEKLVALVYLANKARLNNGEQPLLPARYHLFIRAIEGGYVSLLPEKNFYMERHESVEHNGEKYSVFEAATCRQCSSLYLAGETHADGAKQIFKQPGNRFNDDRDALEYFLFLEGEPVPDNEDELVAGGEAVSGEKMRLCGKCGALNNAEFVDAPCSCGKENYFILIRSKSKQGNVHKCPACGSIRSVGSVVRRFVLGAEAVTSVLGTALYQQIPEKTGDIEVNIVEDDDWGEVVEEQKSNRRLLIFSDSRQDAAYFATYLQGSYNQILSRRILVKALEENREKVLANSWRVDDFAEFTKSLLHDLNLFPGKSRQALETEAWKWVLNEFIGNDRSISLEGLGLLGFTPVLPERWEPQKGLKNQFNLSDDEAKDLMMVLLDSLRRNAAVLFPDSVKPDDEYFAPKNREYFFREAGSVTGRIYSWVPSNDKVINNRIDYLMRLAEATGTSLTRQDANRFLSLVWSKILVGEQSSWRGHLSNTSDKGNGTVFRLRPEFWELQPAVIDKDILWYRCNKCWRLTLHNLRGVCPTYRCDGTLLECNPDDELEANHYRKLYLETLPLTMRTLEHTAQLTTERATEIQKEFYDGKVNILSCSTTFELGVDVGELETVFMRNVPPSAANYIQRAGRAGRRTSSTAFVLTFAQRRSHDFTHFYEPLRIIKGEIKPPYIEITNEKIVKRHMYAVAIALFWRRERVYFGEVKDFFLPEDHSPATVKLKAFLNSQPRELDLAIKRIVPKDMWQRLGIADWSWVDDLLADDEGVLIKAEEDLVSDISQLKELELEHGSSGNYSRANVIKRTINTLERRYILNYLSQRNVIPKYGFPVDVVELQINHHGDEARGLELSRDLKIALSEYAPESQVIAGGKLWTSQYLKKLPQRELVKYSYAICDHCGMYNSDISDLSRDFSQCECGHSIRTKGVFITPEFGFVAGPPAVPSLSKPQKTYSTRKFYSPRDGSVEEEKTIQFGHLNLEIKTGTDETLAVINNAGKRGFKVCSSCGYAEINYGGAFAKHKTPWGKECRGRGQRYSLGYEFKTDILQLSFTETHTAKAGFWVSLLYGLLEGACSALDIDRQDIDGTLYPYNGDRYSPAIILFDDVPGGAGHVKRLAEIDNIRAVMERTYEIVSRCECGGKEGNASCYGCLRSYSNQYCHEELNRGHVMSFLGKLLGKL